MEKMIYGEDLKCCGNCTYRTSLDMGNYMQESCNMKYADSSCMRCERLGI